MADTTPDNKLPDLMNYSEASDKIHQIVGVCEELESIVQTNRALRYTEIDIEAERTAGNLAPDEMYVPQHIIDANVRREQARYISYLSTSRRAVILKNLQEPARPTDVIEADMSDKLRYDGWQTPLYRMIDCMQQNAYGMLELVGDLTKPGGLQYQYVGYGDLGYASDTRDIQDNEMLVRNYYFTKTQLKAMTNPATWGFSPAETEKVLSTQEGTRAEGKDQTLYKVQKVMFRKEGVVQVAWCCDKKTGDWLRAPRPLSLGRKTLNPVSKQWEEAFETAYPYFLFPYNISENVIVRQLKGRAYLDQDTQVGVTSLMSSTITCHRRAANSYFSVDRESDPNSDVVTQSNIYFRPGALINSKVKQFQLAAPDASIFDAIQMLTTANMQENSQINYAANNRQDSRKTATEIQAAQAESQLLSTIQLALFSTCLRAAYQSFFEIYQSRVLSGDVVVSPELKVEYGFKYLLKPAGDVDVVERQEKIARMQQAWAVVQNTPIAPIFLQKLLTLMFPDDAPQYTAKLQDDMSKTQEIVKLATTLGGLIADPSQMSPEAQKHIPQIQQMLQQAQQVVMPQQQTKQ